MRIFKNGYVSFCHETLHTENTLIVLHTEMDTTVLQTEMTVVVLHTEGRPNVLCLASEAMVTRNAIAASTDTESVSPQAKRRAC